MASVIFSGDIDRASEGVLKLLHDAVTNCMTMDPWTGVEEEVARLKANGMRIGEVLRTPRGWHKPEFSFAFQCWNTNSNKPEWNAGNDLRKIAKTIFDKLAYKKLRAIGLDQSGDDHAS